MCSLHCCYAQFAGSDTEAFMSELLPHVGAALKQLLGNQNESQAIKLQNLPFQPFCLTLNEVQRRDQFDVTDLNIQSLTFLKGELPS